MNLFEESHGKLTGLEQLQALIASNRRAPIGDTLDFTLVEVTNGFAAFEGTPGKNAFNPIGSIHGGYAATLLDSACGCAVHTTLSAAQAYTTLELKVAYHRALLPDVGKIRAEGRIISVGKRAAFSEAKLIDASGKLYATATSTLLVFELKPTS